MRFCPFCSAENADELATCVACGRRLPPLPPRRARNAPPTGVQLPPRATASGPPLARKPATIPPAMPVPPRESAPALPPPPQPMTDETAQLTNVLNPAPAAHRREAPPPEIRDGGARRTDVPVPRSNFDDDFNTQAAVPAFDDSLTMPAQDPVTVPRRDAPIPSLGTITSPPASLGTITSPPASLGTITSPPASLGTITSPPASLGTTAPGFAAAPGTTAPGVVPASGPRPAPPRSAPRPSQPPPLGTPRSAPMPAQPPPTPKSAPMPAQRPAPSGEIGVPPGPPSGEIIVPAPSARPPLGAPRLPTNAAVLVEEPPSRPFATPTGLEPPPTRIQAPLADRPFTPPKVLPIPEIPEPGLYASARYAVRFGRARWQRRGAIKLLGIEIKQDTEALDQVLGALGKVARTAKIDGRVFSAENAAITAVEERIVKLGVEHNETDARKADENSKFVDVERERNAKLGEADKLVDEAQRELATVEGQRRGMRDKRKELERRQKAYLKAAEDNDKQSGAAQMGDQRQELRRSAEQHRREAAQLEPDRQEIDRRIAALEKPIAEVTTKLDAAKAELDAAKRSLNDAREGHTHRLAELDAEQKRKAREVSQAEGEIARRLVTLGTLVNLNRIEDPQFEELYTRIDRLRTAITSRTTEIERLAAEREAFDRGTLVRGIAAMGGAVVAFIALIVILRAIL